jgi:tubulin polyglutamylase TTLL6/13
VQQYVSNPYLIESLKFDLRVYVLIMGYDPLRVFIYNEGLGRFATEKYQRVKKKNMKDVYMHLTNYAINKTNKNFVFNSSVREMDKGHKRSLSAIYSLLKAKGLDAEGIRRKIDELVIKTLIVGQPMIAHTYSLAQSDHNASDFCFHILGFDVLINDKLEPMLL